MGMINTCFPGPFESAVTAIVDVQYYLVCPGGMLPDALHAEPCKSQVIPCWYDYCKH
jgi:hypothetical protein